MSGSDGPVPGVRYLDLHIGEFGLGGGSLSTGAKLAMGGLHITLPMRSDTQEQILAYLHQDAPIEMAYAEPIHPLPPIKPKLSPQPIKPKPQRRKLRMRRSMRGSMRCGRERPMCCRRR
jgi:hypothetical protein